MTKKFIVVLFAAVAVFMATFSFSACFKQEDTLEGPDTGISQEQPPLSDGEEDETPPNDGNGQPPEEQPPAEEEPPEAEEPPEQEEPPAEQPPSEETPPEDDGQTEGGNTGGQTQPEEPVHVHRLQKTDERAPTCLEGGNITYWLCSDCGCYFSDEGALEQIEQADIYVPATDHDYMTRKTEATCTQKGYTEYICKNCAHSFIGEHSYTDPLGHSFGEWEELTAATCSHGGELCRRCIRCEYTEFDTTPQLTHTYTQTIEPSTCTQQGYYVYTCTLCLYSYRDETSPLPLAEHTYGDPVVVTPPDCTGTGEQVSTCTVCGKEVFIPLPANGHEYVVKNVNADCENGGYTLYSCTVCGDSYREEESEPLGHDYFESEVTAASCTEEGFTVYACSRCQDSYIADYVEPSGHDYIPEVTPASCTEKGYTVYTCSHCQDSYTSDYVESSGHILKSVNEEPTCTKNGYTYNKCDICDAEFDYEIIESPGHDYIPEVTPASCTGQGFTVYTCSHCQDSYTSDYVEPSGHILKSVNCEPTCTKNGYTYNKCVICDAEFDYEVIESPGHDYIPEVTPASCMGQGFTVYTCSHCQDSYTSDYIEPFGHDYIPEVTPASCTEEGYTTYTCSVCHDSYIDDCVEPFGHDFKEEITTPAGCEEEGECTFTCARCGYAYRESVPKTGHSYGEWYVKDEPGCEEKGICAQACSACGRENSKEIPASGHEYSETIVPPSCEDGGYTLHTCVRCGDEYKDTPTDASGHKFGEWHVTVSPSCTQQGKEERICSVCKKAEYAAIERLEHEYVMNMVPASCEDEGYTVYTCAGCGDTYNTDATPALGHDWTAAEEGYLENGAPYVKYICTRCDKEKTEEGEAPAATAGLEFALSADGTYYIVSGISAAEDGDVALVIPAVQNGLPVCEIASNAFYGNASIISAVLPHGLKKIGDGAFAECINMQSVNIPQTVETIGSDAFVRCTALEKIDYDAACAQNIPMGVFKSAGAEGGGITLYVGASVRVIPANLFNCGQSGSVNLVNIVFEDGCIAEEIGDSAFSFCKKLKSVTLPAGIKRIGSEAFYGCSALSSVLYPQGAQCGSGAFGDVDSDCDISTY